PGVRGQILKYGQRDYLARQHAGFDDSNDLPGPVQHVNGVSSFQLELIRVITIDHHLVGAVEGASRQVMKPAAQCVKAGEVESRNGIQPARRLHENGSGDSYT